MLARSKTIVLLVCLLLVTFKVAASSIFIQTAIERAQIAGASVELATSHQTHDANQSADDKEQVHTMYLMSHVTANVSEFGILIPLVPARLVAFKGSPEILFTQNFPDSVFKPPKTSS
jgi:hypothetical protein